MAREHTPGLRAPQPRTRSDWWDRVKILLLLVGIIVFFVSSRANGPFITYTDAFEDFRTSVVGIIVMVLLGLEILRQVHYLVAERSGRYWSWWKDAVLGSVERQLNRISEWTRFRIRRAFKWVVIAMIYAYGASYLMDDVAGPIEAVTNLPGIVAGIVFNPLTLRIAALLVFVVGQFVLIFWFLSRGGIDVIYPEEIETRFDDIWGQDHVLDLIKENMAFLEKPDEIEAKGGYIPGGILLWGPPGTGKTLIAEGIAGETGRPFVFVDPGAFIQMFMGVGILKVKRLYRKLRKLSLQHGGVIVFFDEADSLGSRGSLAGQGVFQPMTASPYFQCNGTSFMSAGGQRALLTAYGIDPDSLEDTAPRRGLSRFIMGGMGGGGGMGTLQALLTEMNGLKKPRGISNKIRRALGMKPKPPPKYRILTMMATNMPNALDEAMLRPGRIDRIYKVGYPSVDGRLETLKGYLAKVSHSLTEEQQEKLAIKLPYYSGAKIKDLVNEGLILAIRDGRDSITWDDIWRGKALKELGPPEDAEYIEREQHAVAIHEAGHALATQLLSQHRSIDIVSIEKRSNSLGLVQHIQAEERVTHWRTEYEADIKISLASLAAEKMFFEGDNSSGVSGDLQNATQLAAFMEGAWGMGEGIASYAGAATGPMGQPANPVGAVLGARGKRVDRKLQELYDEVWQLLDTHRAELLRLARVLTEKRTITGDEVTEVLGIEPGHFTAHEPTGFALTQPRNIGPDRNEDPDEGPNGEVQVTLEPGEVVEPVAPHAPPADPVS